MSLMLFKAYIRTYLLGYHINDLDIKVGENTNNMILHVYVVILLDLLQSAKEIKPPDIDPELRFKR